LLPFHLQEAPEITAAQPIKAEIVTPGELQKRLVLARQGLRDLIMRKLALGSNEPDTLSNVALHRFPLVGHAVLAFTA
jgi:hypothetical protein